MGSALEDVAAAAAADDVVGQQAVREGGWEIEMPAARVVCTERLPPLFCELLWRSGEGWRRGHDTVLAGSSTVAGRRSAPRHTVPAAAAAAAIYLFVFEPADLPDSLFVRLCVTR